MIHTSQLLTYSLSPYLIFFVVCSLGATVISPHKESVTNSVNQSTSWLKLTECLFKVEFYGFSECLWWTSYTQIWSVRYFSVSVIRISSTLQTATILSVELFWLHLFLRAGKFLGPVMVIFLVIGQDVQISFKQECTLTKGRMLSPCHTISVYTVNKDVKCISFCYTLGKK